MLFRSILEVDSTTRFSWLLLGREPGSCAELLMVYAAVLAHGTSLTAADIARMVPELASAAIQQMMNRIADERKLRQAADAVHGIHAPASDRGTLGACRPGIVGHDGFWTPPKSA